MMHVLLYSRRSGRPHMLTHLSDAECESGDVEFARAKTPLPECYGVMFGSPLPLVWVSGHPRLHEMQRMASEATGKIPYHLHPEVRAFVMASPMSFEVVHDRFCEIARDGSIVATHYAEPSSKVRDGNSLVLHDEAQPRTWCYDGRFVRVLSEHIRLALAA